MIKKEEEFIWMYEGGEEAQQKRSQKQKVLRSRGQRRKKLGCRCLGPAFNLT